MKNLALVVAGLCLGVFLGVFFAKKPQEQKWAEAGIEKIDTLPREDQLKAAEEYYGKAVVLYLASLGGRVLKDQAKLAEPIIKEIDPKDLPPQESITAAESNALTEVTLAKDEMKSFPAEKPLEKKAEQPLDRFIAFKKASVFDKLTPQVRKVLGAFEGVLKHTAKGKIGRVDQIVMNMNFAMQDGKLMGDGLITITDPEGRTYSRSTFDGKNDKIRAVAGRRDQVYIEPAPGDFILLDISNNSQMRGTYFDSDGLPVGSVMLWRKQ